jgi:BASS family bile acid:Na+ symporter
MQLVIEFGLPLLIMFAMAIVGLELTLADLARVMHYPGEVAISLVGQILVLPLVGAGVLLLLRPEPAVAGGLILIAAAPQAIVSSYFCLLARANIALAVTLTATSSLLAVLSTPLAAGLTFELLLEQQAGFALPVAEVMQQVVTGLLLPITAGMFLRHYAPAFVGRNRVRFQRASLVALAVLLALITADQAQTIQRNLVPLLLAAGAFTFGALAIGAGVAAVATREKADKLTLLAAFPARSLSVATLVAVNVLGRHEFLSIVVVFFMMQVLIIVPAMLLVRSRIPAPAAAPELEPPGGP